MSNYIFNVYISRRYVYNKMKINEVWNTMNNYSKYLIQENSTVKDALVRLNKLSGNVQTLFVLNKYQIMLGTLTDGDIRRALISGVALENKIEQVSQDRGVFYQVL